MIPIDNQLDTSNVIVILYPRGTGGKTLINCLAFSDKALLPEDRLALLQIHGKLSQEDKFNIVMDRLKNTSKDKWNDLKLGSVRNWAYNYLADPKNNNDIETIYNSNKYIFYVAHNNQMLHHRNHWFHSTYNSCIMFKNSSKLLNVRAGFSYSDDFIIDTNIIPCNIYNFDPAGFLNNDYIKSIERLYKIFKMPDFNSEIITKYINAWREKIIDK